MMNTPEKEKAFNELLIAARAFNDHALLHYKPKRGRADWATHQFRLIQALQAIDALCKTCGTPYDHWTNNNCPHCNFDKR